MLDSGASLHFTSIHSDFVTFKLLQKPVPVQTMNGFTHITGFGTVELGLCKNISTPIMFCLLNKVYYIPDLNHRLLSVGQFLQDG